MAEATENQEETQTQRIEEIQNMERDSDWILVDCIGKTNNESVTYDSPNNERNYDYNFEFRKRQDVLRSINSQETACVSAQSEESDSASIITESDEECNSVNNEANEVSCFRDKACSPIKLLEGNTHKSIGIALNAVFACSLGIMLGLAAYTYYSGNNRCSIPNDIVYKKNEGNNIISHNLNELIKLNSVITEIKKSIAQTKRDIDITMEHTQQGKKTLDNDIKESFKTQSFYHTSLTLEQLQSYLNTLSLAMSQINPTDLSIQAELNETHNIITDVNKFFNIMKALMEQNQQFNIPMEAKFVQHTNGQIRDVTQSLLFDVSSTLHELIINVYNKLKKIKYKLNRRICNIRNTLPNRTDFLKELDKDNSLLHSCDKPLYVKTNVFGPLNNKKVKKQSKKYHNLSENDVKNKKRKNGATQNNHVNYKFVQNNNNVKSSKNHSQWSTESSEKITNADWQFKRFRDRENHRNPFDRNEENQDFSNWYLTRAYLRQKKRNSDSSTRHYQDRKKKEDL